MFFLLQMNVGVAHSEVNPNTRVMNSRGIWLTYLLLTVVLHVVLLSIPFLTVPLVWTLTNVIHNLVSPNCSMLIFYSQKSKTLPQSHPAQILVYLLWSIFYLIAEEKNEAALFINVYSSIIYVLIFACCKLRLKTFPTS